jgi:hypothetical protein
MYSYFSSIVLRPCGVEFLSTPIGSTQNYFLKLILQAKTPKPRTLQPSQTMGTYEDQLGKGSSNLTESDLIFSPQANHNFSRILTDLKKSNLSITNRLHSIKGDASFIAEVADAFNRPLIANERCGSWYIPPEDKSGSAYFKSTDGHAGQWKFSARRLNLHLLGIIGENDGCIIVDSTRRGKRMPDALSKTSEQFSDMSRACQAIF